jgi:uncharacterized protein (TIGR03118 family)
MTFLLSKWLRAPKRTRAHRIVPRLESLEDRTLPSTLAVTSVADDGSAGTLRAVITAATNGDTIAFDPSLDGQTIKLTSGEVAIAKSLDIEGPGAALLTISGDKASRVFDISGSTTSVTIAGLTIADGLASSTTTTGPYGNVAMGGAILNTGAQVTLSGVTLLDNHATATQTGYIQTNLVSDIAGLAQLTDPNLKNPWGTSFAADGSFSISNQKTNVSTLYSVTAAGVSAESPTVIIPTTAAGPQGPTGQVSNDTSSFLVNGAPAGFIYADLNGNIYAWNSSLGTTAQVEATVTGAAYTGLNLESTAAGDFLYAANPKQGRLDVFDGSFHRVTPPAGAFVDPQLPVGLVPFSVDDVNGDLYVMYAAAGPPAARSSASLGSGAIAVYDTSGTFIKQLTSGGNLASPWAIALAPSTFGQFGGDLLVGNFSYAAPEINAFDPSSGAYLGTLTDSSGNTLLSNAQGIWDMTFGNGSNGGNPNTLYFVTGLNAENDGLFGAIDAVPEIATGGAVANVSGGSLAVSDSVFTDNQAIGNIRGSGGALVNDASTLVLDSSIFTGNRAITVLGSAAGIQGNALSGAIYNAGGGQAAISNSVFAYNSAHGGNGANGTAAAPNGGNAGTGVGGAVGNEAISLLGPFTPSTMTVADSLFVGNQVIGGTGGDGWAGGGNGGNGSSGGLTAAGGAINNGSSTLTVTGSTFLGDEALGGSGGNGAGAGIGGAGAAGAGGAISSVPTPTVVTGRTVLVRATLHVSHSQFLGNEAIGGAGGNGGSTGNGGAGGAGQGGGLRLSLTDWTVSNGVFVGNQAQGGAGGDRGSGGSLGGAGGVGQGAGLINFNGAIGTVSDSTFVVNAAVGGAGGLGGNGGNGQGAGAFNGAPAADGTLSSLTLQRSRIVNNSAIGGAAGAGGMAGQGIGGGLYLTPGGDACADALTHIRNNHATTSNDDVFGALGPC